MNALNLLNKHLEPLIELGGKMYPKSKVDRVYAKLSAPKTNGLFYDKNRVRAEVHPDGQVAFQTSYPELGDHFDHEGWSVYSPEEMGMTRTSPKPVRGMIGMQKAFNQILDSHKGDGLYYNDPISAHRSNTYEGRGFAAPPGQSRQFLDNRRFRNNSTVAELLALQDANYFGYEPTALLREQLLAKHPAAAARVQQALSPRRVTPVTSNELIDDMSDDAINAWLASF